MSWRIKLKDVISSFLKGCSFCSGMLFVLFFLLFILKSFIGFNRLSNLKNAFFLSPSPDKNLVENLKELASTGHIISFDSLFIQTLTYYDSLITILVGILGITIAGAFFYIKQNSEDKSREYLEKGLKIFLETKEFDEQIQQSISNQLDNQLEDIPKTLDKISILESKISSLEESQKTSNEEILIS